MPRKKQQLKDSLKSKDRCVTVFGRCDLQCVREWSDPCVCIILSQYHYHVITAVSETIILVRSHELTVRKWSV